MYAATFTGTAQLYTWDRETDTHRQATDRPNGTYVGALDPHGEYLWWFDDPDGDDWGTWKRQPFHGGAATPALPGLPPAYPAGLAIGTGVVVAGRVTESGSSIHLVREGYEFTLYSSASHAFVAGMSRDESLLCLAHTEHGDPMHRALRVVRIEDGERVAELWDGHEKSLSASGFSPIKGDCRLLVNHEREGKSGLLIWDPLADRCELLAIHLPGEIDADWYPDGRALLVSHDHAGRTELYRYDLASGQLARVGTPPGVVSGATARPDGSVEFAWSSAAVPAAILTTASGGVLLSTPGEPPPGSVPLEDIWVQGPGGPIHALLARPPQLLPPYSTVFMLHPGPDSADDDTFRPRRAAWVDAGYCVVHVNYRGSTGYGEQWRDALQGRPGLTELEDVAAVQDWVVSRHLANPERCIISGSGWGGYLALLGLGVQPDRWAAGIATGPIADYPAAYQEEVEPLQAMDAALFGGTPQEIAGSYQRSSPMTYIAQINAPLLVLAGANDPRCPPKQLDGYLLRLTEIGKAHEVYRYEAGVGLIPVDEQIRQMYVEIEFALRHVRP